MQEIKPSPKYLEKMAEEILKDINQWWDEDENVDDKTYDEAIKLAAIKGYERGRREAILVGKDEQKPRGNGGNVQVV